MKCGIVIVALVFVFSPPVVAQSYRSLVNDGNELYEEKRYDDAIVKYKKGAEAEPERRESYFNMGNAYYRSNRHKEAVEAFQKAIPRVVKKKQAADVLYNIGDSFLDMAEKAEKTAQADPKAGEMIMQGYQNAIKAFKETLKLDPKNEDARYNLMYAKKKLEDFKKKSQSKKNQKQKQKKKQDQKQDKQQDQKQDKQQDKKQKQQQKQQKQKQQRKQQKMSKEQAEQILNALRNDEKELQKKLRKVKARRVPIEKDW
ncbi:MAG: tetratricopeptide repeat protein [Chlorobi bacterium]|nr:tetratricopeptide repeat protein [Chlorobiota bacterium]